MDDGIRKLIHLLESLFELSRKQVDALDRRALGDLEKIQDYSATLVKRERIDGKLNDTEYMFVKVRHRPFSVYSYFLAPAKLKGQEVIYIEGANNGNMWAHTTGILSSTRASGPCFSSPAG